MSKTSRSDKQLKVNSVAMLGNKRVLLIVLLMGFVLSMSAQESNRFRHYYEGDRIRSYVLCNGRKVNALYRVRRGGRTVALGGEDYRVTAIDTSLIGRIEVPSHITGPDGRVLAVNCVSRHALADCRHITEVVLPDCLRDIGDQSFMNCRSLRSIVLPPYTSNIWPYAFRGCSSLQRITVTSEVPPDAYNDVFDERTLRLATLVVPASKADSYRNAFIWNMFRYLVANWDQ